MSTIAIIPIPGVPQIKPGDDLPALLLKAIDDAKVGLKDGDILVICQKIVSKAEGAVVDLRTVTPSPFATQIADMWEKDPRMVEVVLTESSRIVRMKNGVVITESKHGWVCANSGVDASNTLADDVVILLPKDPDASARNLRLAIEQQRHISMGVIITDTFGRPWRDGLVEFALGVSGLDPARRPARRGRPPGARTASYGHCRGRRTRRGRRPADGKECRHARHSDPWLSLHPGRCRQRVPETPGGHRSVSLARFTLGCRHAVQFSSCRT